MSKKKLVALTGAGVSAESGLKTFRDADGLWENHNIMEVATPEAWQNDKDLVLRFYNERRRQLSTVHPNEAHKTIAELEEYFDVCVVTQNVDDLHERGGSTNIVHLHGELKKSRSTWDENLVYDCESDINPGDTCELGSQLRPHIVWFGEMVPMIEAAANEVAKADIILIVGTSMQVYPAAGLASYAKPKTEIYYIDPNPAPNYELNRHFNVKIIPEKATTGMRKVFAELTALAN
jgi:NAD-dependent deacetylase